VGTGLEEFDYPKAGTNAKYRHPASGGVPLRGFFSRVLWSIRLKSTEVLFSGYIKPDSQVLMYRAVTTRVRKIAPWLNLDESPYPALVDGRIVWILDAYTSSDHYPYSQPLPNGTNYMRDSVKVVVDAYNGDMTFYANGDDPIRDAWSKIFPGVITEQDKAAAALAAHFRYPEKYFAAQSAVYRTYHMTDPTVFYNKEDQWQIVGEKRGNPVNPSYVMLDFSGSPGMWLMQPYAPPQRDNMIGIMTAACEPADYGQQTVLVLSKERVVLGPQQIKARIEQDPIISPQLSLWDQRGSKVILGEMLVLPVEDSIVYVQPVFLTAAESAIRARRGQVINGDACRWADASALAVLAPGAGQAAAERLALSRRSGRQAVSPAQVTWRPTTMPSPPRARLVLQHAEHEWSERTVSPRSNSAGRVRRRPRTKEASHAQRDRVRVWRRPHGARAGGRTRVGARARQLDLRVGQRHHYRDGSSESGLLAGRARGRQEARVGGTRAHSRGCGCAHGTRTRDRRRSPADGGRPGTPGWLARRLALIFFAPALLLAMVSPLGVRLAASRGVERIGRSAGGLYAVSTGGSIVGTLATSFWLIPLLSLEPLIVAIGFMLFATALAALALPSRYAQAVDDAASVQMEADAETEAGGPPVPRTRFSAVERTLAIALVVAGGLLGALVLARTAPAAADSHGERTFRRPQHHRLTVTEATGAAPAVRRQQPVGIEMSDGFTSTIAYPNYRMSRWRQP
jgi:hypothetical protein